MKRLLLLLSLLSFVPLLAPAQTPNYARMLSGINYVSASSYTVQASDVTKIVVLRNASGTAVTLPPGSSANFGAGTIYVLQGGPTSGTVTVSCACMMNNSGVPITIGANQTATFQSDGAGYVVSTGSSTGAAVGQGLQNYSGNLGLGPCPSLQVQVSTGSGYTCGATGTGNVSTNQLIGAQNVVQPAVAGVSTPFSANNFAFWRVVTPSWNWSYTDSAGSLGDLTSPGTVTLTLPCTAPAPCPLGIDTTSAAKNYIYRIYISGTGTAEAALVTGGTCTSGATASCTLVVTTANAHANGYVIGSSTGGIQEAWNDAWVNDSGTAPNANSQAGPYVKLSADTTYPVFSSIYLRGRGGVLDGAGALLVCSTRDRCVFVGTTAGLVNMHKIYNLNGTSNVNQNGVQVSSVVATAGSYTITTASTHGFVVGDSVVCEYYSQTVAQQWMAVVTGKTGTTFNVVVSGGLTFSAGANTFGFCNVENAFIEDNSDHVKMDTIDIFQSTAGSCGAGCSGTFSYGIVDDNDQQLDLGHLSNRGSPILQSTVTNALFPIGAMVYERSDQGNAGIVYLHHSELTNVNCITGGGNGMVVSDTVCQAFPLYGIRYYGSLQPLTATNVYQDHNGDNPLYHAVYSQAVPAAMGFLVQGGRQARIVGAFPTPGQTPQFPCTAGGGGVRNYFVVPHVSTNGGGGPGVGSPLYVGMATGCNSGNITVAWPSIQLQDRQNNPVGTLTWDVLMTTGTNAAPVGTGTFYLTTPGSPVSGSCNTGGMCTFVDTQAPAVPGTVAAQTFNPQFWFWPASYAINFGNSLHLDVADTTPFAVASVGTGSSSIIADQCGAFGNAFQRTPIWVTCLSNSSLSGQGTVAEIMQQTDSAGNGPLANSKGRINFGKALNVVPTDLFTLQDSNFLKTLSTAGGRASNDAGDMAIGTDVAGGLNFRAPTSLSLNINTVPTGTNWLAKLNASAFSTQIPVIIPALGPGTNFQCFIDGLINTTIQNCATTAEVTNGLRSSIIFSNVPELFTVNPSPVNYALELKLGTGLHSTTCTAASNPLPCWLMQVPFTVGSGSTITGTGFVNSGGDYSGGTVLKADTANWVPPLGVPTVSAPTCVSTGGSIANGTTIFWQISTERNVETNPTRTAAPGISMPTTEASFTCSLGTSTQSLAGTAPSAVGTAPFQAKDYLIALGTVSGGEVVQPNDTTHMACGVTGTVDAANACGMSGGYTVLSLQSGTSADRPLPLADLSNCMFYVGPIQTVSFAEQFRDLTIDAGTQTVNSPNEVICNFSGQELSLNNAGSLTIQGSPGGFSAGATGTTGGSATPFPGGDIYEMSRTPNGQISHCQISGGPTSGAATFIPIIFDGRADGGGVASGVPRGIDDCTINPKGTTATVPEVVLVTGPRARANFTNIHMETNSAGGDGIAIANGAWGSGLGIEGQVTTTGSLVRLLSTAQGGKFDALCSIGTATSSDARCAGKGQSATGWTFRDDTVSPSRTFKGWQGSVKGGVCNTTNTPACTNANVLSYGEQSLQLADQGTCTMNGTTGCPAQTLSHTYAQAPNCWATWTGSGTLTGFIKVPSTTTTVTPASSVAGDTAVMNWFCLGY